MGRSRESKDINARSRSEQDRIDQEHNRLSELLYGRQSALQQREDAAYNDIYGGYKGFLGRDRSADRPDFGFYERGYKDFANTGGLSAENIARMRGGGGYDEFAKTGGYSTQDKANIRARGTATIPSFYDAIRESMRNQARISGSGPGTSYTSSLSRVARDQARGGQEAALDAELDIMDRVNAGRQWGISGMSGAEGQLADLLTRNKLAGLSGGFGVAEAGGRYDLANRGLDLEALSGMRGLRTDQPASDALYNLLLGTIGQRGELAGGNLQRRMAYNPNKGFMDHLKEILGPLSEGAATYFAPGIASKLRRGSNPWTNPANKVVGAS